jgi:hypothetical protein
MYEAWINWDCLFSCSYSIVRCVYGNNKKCVGLLGCHCCSDILESLQKLADVRWSLPFSREKEWRSCADSQIVSQLQEGICGQVPLIVGGKIPPGSEAIKQHD